MSRIKSVTRRTALKLGAGSMAGMAAIGTGSTAHAARKAGKAGRYPSEYFYTDGSFDVKKAKEAYFDMMNRFAYPIPDVLKTDEFWTSDFLSADFAHIGMGGIFWINESGTYGKNGAAKYTGTFKEQQFGYLGHELCILPGQALPEHNHIGGAEGYGPKMEAWHVRYGEVEFFGEYKGAGDETLISDMPKKDRPVGYGEDWFKSKYVAKRTAKSGQLYVLEDPESWHFQRAGAEGAIVSEYATYHNHVQFSKPGMAFENTTRKD